jgi:hypothetical protein
MKKFFCDLTNRQFASSMRDRSEPRHYIPQNNNLPFRLYLLQFLGSASWPYAHDTWSGSEAITAIVSLRDFAPANILASTEPLTPIRNGFEGILHTNTLEVDEFVASRGEREAFFSVELIDALGNKLNPFRRPVILQSTPGNVVSAAGAVFYFPEVTAYLGAGPEALQSKPTVGRTGVIFEAVINGILVSWRVEAGVAATDLDNGIIRPLDFDADANSVNLVRVGGI